MKKITLLLILGIRMFSVSGQSTSTPPPIVFDEKTPATIYRKGDDQKISFKVRSTASIGSGVTTAVLNATLENPDNSVLKITPVPLRMTFGTGYPSEYDITFDLKKDTTIKVPCLIKITITNDSTKKEINHYNMIYQPSEALTKSTESKLIKSNDDIKADLNVLRTQLLNGDTSRTYIGKLYITEKLSIVPNGAKNIKSKKDLDDFIAQNLSKSSNGKIPIDLDNKNKKQYQQQIAAIGYIQQKEIANVTVKITEGVIEYLKVQMKDSSYFYNTKAPISLLNIENRFKDKLFNPYDDTFIFVADVLNFQVDRRFNYFPADGTFYLSNNSGNRVTERKLYANNGLNSFVDLRLFTDLLGALDNQPNGLLQIEAKSKIYLHTHNVPNTFMFLFDGIEPYFGLSKLDSKYDTVKLNATTNSISRMDLYQRSFLNVGLKLNIFHWDFRPTNKLFVNAGYQFNASNISIRDNANKADSIVSKGIFHTPYFEMGILSKRLEGFGFEGSARYMFQLLNSNKYFTNSGYSRLMDFNVTAFYYLGKTSKDKFFVRFSNVLNFKERREDFYQLQFGYSLNLKI